MSLPFTAPLAAHEHAVYADAAAMVAALRPEQPVYCIRPHVLREAARHFVETFPGPG